METSALPFSSAAAPLRALAALAAAVSALLAATACSSYPPGPARVGASPQQTVAALGPPTARHRLTQGERLEYATGPAGRETWMLDVDAQGRISAVQQVLTDTSLQAWQSRLATQPLPTAELLAGIGSPSQRRAGGRIGGQVWSWRYATFDCLWFQVLVDERGLAHSATFGPDPACDTRHGRD